MFCFLVLLLEFASACPVIAEEPSDVGRLGEQVEQLVEQLTADRQQDRDAAHQGLLELAGNGTQRADRVLELLPEPTDEMPPALSKSLRDLRVAIEKRIAKSATAATQVTLDMDEAPLAHVLAAMRLHTDNKLLDNREQFGQQAAEKLVTLKLTDVPFWEALDAVLDQTEMDVYAYSGEDALALVNRDPGSAQRSTGASYAGPFRIAASNVTATRNLRRPADQSLGVLLDIAWEPRLRPIALSQKLTQVVATTESGARLSLKQPEETIDLEPTAGNQATEMRLPFVLPERSTLRIATLRGTLEVLAPGRKVQFKFPKLKAGTEAITKRRGGVTVSLAGVRKNGAVWEVHMRLKLDQPGEALASHRGWVFENLTYVLDKNGQKIDHAGFETTMQTKEEIGLAYLFDHQAGIEGLTWVYETPASVHRFPVEYELKDIELP